MKDTRLKPPTLEELRQQKRVSDSTQLQAETRGAQVTPLGKPDNIPADVWNLIQESGRVATERLHELLVSTRFTRLRSSDQARLIKLAQDRAYGAPANSKSEQKNSAYIDVTAEELGSIADKSELPEYKRKLD